MEWAAAEKEAERHAEELLAEVEAEKRAKGKKGKKKKKGGGATVYHSLYATVAYPDERREMCNGGIK